MELRREWGSTRQDERRQRRQILVERVAVLFQSLDVALGDPKRFVCDIRGSGEVRADVEQIVLNFAKDLGDIGCDLREGQREPDGCIGFIAVGISDEPSVVLRNSGEVTETCRAVVAGTRIDPRQVDRHGNNVTAKFARTIWDHSPVPD